MPFLNLGLAHLGMCLAYLAMVEYRPSTFVPPTLIVLLGVRFDTLFCSHFSFLYLLHLYIYIYISNFSLSRLEWNH